LYAHAARVAAEFLQRQAAPHPPDTLYDPDILPKRDSS